MAFGATRFEIGVHVIVLRGVRPFRRVIFSFRNESRVDASMLPLFHCAVGFDLDVSITQLLASLVRAFHGIGRFLVHAFLLSG